jgi:hypothetical protein
MLRSLLIKFTSLKPKPSARSRLNVGEPIALAQYNLIVADHRDHRARYVARFHLRGKQLVDVCRLAAQIWANQ